MAVDTGVLLTDAVVGEDNVANSVCVGDALLRNGVGVLRTECIVVPRVGIATCPNPGQSQRFNQRTLRGIADTGHEQPCVSQGDDIRGLAEVQQHNPPDARKLHRQHGPAEHVRIVGSGGDAWSGVFVRP